MDTPKAVLMMLAGIATVALAFGIACGGSDEPSDQDSSDREARRAERATRRASEEARSSPATPVSGSGVEPTALPRVEPTVDPSNPFGAIVATPAVAPGTVELTPTAVQTLVPTSIPTPAPTATPTPAPTATPTQVPTPTPPPFTGPPLHQAVFEGNQEKVEELLNLGEDVNAVDGNGKTPLYLAVEQDNPEMAGLLLAWEAHLAAPEGWDLLHVASATNSIDMAGLLLDRGSDIEAYGDGYWKPLHGPLERNIPEFVGHGMMKAVAVERIVTRSDGLRHYVSDTYAWRALHLAVAAGNIKMARLLLDRGADIEARCSLPLRLAPLQVAVAAGNTEVGRVAAGPRCGH